jgi:hypothetical protein
MMAPMGELPSLMAYKVRFSIELGERRCTLSPYLGSTSGSVPTPGVSDACPGMHRL